MIRTIRSPEAGPNDQFTALARRRGEDNVDWCRRVLAERPLKDMGQRSAIVLLGGRDTLAFRLRVAQSHLRADMLPSYWTHSLLVLGRPGDIGAETGTASIPLHQPDGPHFAPDANGVVYCPLSAYRDADRYANIALLLLPVDPEALARGLKLFSSSRATLDALEHVLRWLAFSWGVAGTGNPLHDNYGLPSACMLEAICASAGYDLTPGLESRASCPEAIWAAARRWHEYYLSSPSKEVPAGRFSIGHTFPIAESPERIDPTQLIPPAGKPGVSAKAAAKAKKSAKAATKHPRR